MTINYLDGSPENIRALKAAATLADKLGIKYEEPEKDFTFTEEEEEEVTPTPSAGNSVLLVRIVSTTQTPLYYNVEVYPYGINGGGVYIAKLFFGEKAWTASIPVGAYLVVNSISVTTLED